MPAKHIFLVQKTNDILARYSNGESRQSIAKTYNVTHKVITRVLLENGKTLRNDKRKHFYDQTIFEKINTPEKAYWIGFITADGYVNESRGFLRIKLGTNDRDHLIKFLQFMGFSNLESVIKYEYHNITNNKMFYIDISSRKIVNQLVHLGIRQAKSTCEKVAPIPDDYICDYIRGLIDGDGSIRPNGTGVSLNNSIEILHYVQKIFWLKLKVSKLKIMDHCNTWKIEYRSKDIVKKILIFLYYKNCLALDRKQLLVNKICRPEPTVAEDSEMINGELSGKANLERVS